MPAHTAYPHMRPGAMPPRGAAGRPLYPHQGQPPIYGAHGQPLGPPMPHDPNYPPPPPGYGMPYQGPMYDDRGPPPPHHGPDKVSLKRPRSNEFQPAVPAPPPPTGDASSHAYPGREPASTGEHRESGGGGTGGYEYPDPTSVAPVSPTSSVQSFHSGPYPPAAQPYYPAPSHQQPPPPPPPQQQASQPPPQGPPPPASQQPPPRRSSPQSAYSYEARASGSPHGSTSSTSNYQYPPTGLHPPQVLPPQGEVRTPTPGNQNRESNGNGSAQRGGMAVKDLLGPGQTHDASGGRSSADSNMLNALNKKM